MRALALLAALALAACATDGAETTAEEPAASEESAPGEGTPGDDTPALSLGDDAGAAGTPADEGTGAPRYGPGDVPVIFMAIEDGGSREHSVVFAIDQDRDGSAADEQAIRITPEPSGDGTGECNPQNLTRYGFAEGDPVFDYRVANANGMQARELPRFLSFAASQALLRSGLVETEEEAVPINICTRKLWEALLLQNQEGAETPSG